jgi:5-methylcytosine-specific restriction enzyme subunit McrC
LTLDGDFEVSASSVVGTIVLPTVRLLIRPKVDLVNLFFLLGFRPGLIEWSGEQFPYEEEPDFFQAVVWMFDAAVGRALGQGVSRGYVGREEGLSTIRGRIDVGRQATLRQGLALPLECRFDEYTEDIALNRLIKAALRQLQGVPGLELALRLRLRHRMRPFAEVADVRFALGGLPRLSFTRLDEQWEASARLASLILQSQSIRDRTGDVVGAAFTVDMNKVFEKFVEEVIRDEAVRVGLELVSQAETSLTQNIWMRPDFVLAEKGRAVAVGDAKYKKDIEGLPHADVYQLLSYCVALGLPRGLLIYASNRPFAFEVVEKADVRLEVIGIDLGRSPTALLVHARAAAQRLLVHWRPFQVVGR